jgi:alkylation response protein AidB-like acyl-CoA dehydrogenase
LAGLWAPRALFEDVHHEFRDSVARFVEQHVHPYVEAWDTEGTVPRSLWEAAARQGLLGLSIPEELGGGGEADYRFRAVLIEEALRVNAASVNAGFSTHEDVVLPYFRDLCDSEQAPRWLPGLCSGETIGAIAMTEPGAGSDLRGIRTHARRDGSGWLLNGAKTFITNGIHSDVVIVVARTDASADADNRAFTLFVVERGMPGFERGRKLDKIGMRSQDTAELVFDEVRLPAANVLGEVGGGLPQLMAHLPVERLSIAVTACAGARAALSWTVDYVRDRSAFGAPLASFQNTRFVLAELVTELDVTQTYVDDAIRRVNAGQLSAVHAAKSKWWATEMHKRVVDRCVQLFGGYGYMLEYPIARAYTDIRVSTIFGGTTEIMKIIIARDLLDAR